MASTANAKLKQVQSAKKLAHAGVINSTSSFIPKINAFGMVSIYDYQLSSLSPDYMVGVQMSLNLFDGLQNYHQLKASIIRVKFKFFVKNERRDTIGEMQSFAAKLNHIANALQNHGKDFERTALSGVLLASGSIPTNHNKEHLMSFLRQIFFLQSFGGQLFF